MATTLATDKQAQAIKQRMQQIRTNLPYEVDQARDQVKELSDWKYHFRRHPAALLSAAAVVGYLLVPSKSPSPKHFVIERRVPTDRESIEPTKKSLIGGLVGVVATIAVRQAVSIAAGHVSSVLTSQSRAGR
ncbi:hypothetical protein [Rhodopirellula sp. MGV]|uniref:hypothetical protein n=1 Tax=Rhodopirellula sp. MGV TaxID=2023130 RepID=UPI000B969F43|nr:hypothetical protein [Rhodopirellula sp. MGV]OYP28889.1 hypothetical protein CGZ80_25305 [Rhodopirellula sp. MGV]PNY36994.1 hypothetical protein C2E31_10305 [Rhodopirellula baltica]